MPIKKINQMLSWHPGEYTNYEKHYPNTPSLPKINNLLNQSFIDIWENIRGYESDSIENYKNDFVVYLVKGIYGNYYKSNLRGIYNFLKGKNISVIFPEIDYAAGIKENASSLFKQFKKIKKDIIVLAHSKGGLDTLYAIAKNPELDKKVKIIGIAQSTRGSSVIFDSILNKAYKNSLKNVYDIFKERFFNLVLRTTNKDRGAYDLIGDKLDYYINVIDEHNFTKKLFAVATWSLVPCSLLESYHKRLEEIRPGCAHDGLFYLEDQIWNAKGQLILGNIDHSQIVIGGNGFDEALFWRAYLELMLKHSKIS